MRRKYHKEPGKYEFTPEQLREYIALKLYEKRLQTFDEAIGILDGGGSVATVRELLVATQKQAHEKYNEEFRGFYGTDDEDQVKAKLDPTEDFENKVAVNIWDDNLSEVIETIKILTAENEENDWIWVKNTQCKYVSLRIDMRDGGFILLNRDDKRISLEQLRYQYQPKGDQ